MENELFKLLATGGITTAFAGVLIWIVVKQMPHQQQQFIDAQQKQQDSFVSAQAKQHDIASTSQERFLSALEKQRMESTAMLERERAAFLEALNTERDKFHADREKDREARHYIGNVVNSLALNLAQAGVKFTVEQPKKDEKT